MMENLQIDIELNEANDINKEQILVCAINLFQRTIILFNTSYSLKILSELSFTCKYMFFKQRVVSKRILQSISHP